MIRAKRFFSAILTSLLLGVCILFSGCLQATIEGTYKFNKMTYMEGGVQIELKAGEEFMGMMTLSEDFMTLTLNEDGTASMKASDGEGEETSFGSWKKIDDETIEITFDDEPQTCKCDGTTITIEDEGAKIVLKK